MRDDYIKIGKSILNKYAGYAKTEFIDDEAEYFPTVRVIIEGLLGTLESSEKREEIESILIDHVKQNYVSLWVNHAKEDDEDPDIDYEKSRAISRFEQLYYDK